MIINKYGNKEDNKGLGPKITKYNIRLGNGTGRTGTVPVRSGSSRFGCLRDGPGYSKPVHGTGRNRSFVPVYRYRFIPVHSGSGPVRSGSGPVYLIYINFFIFYILYNLYLI